MYGDDESRPSEETRDRLARLRLQEQLIEQAQVEKGIGGARSRLVAQQVKQRGRRCDVRRAGV